MVDTRHANKFQHERHQARKLALQILCQADVQGDDFLVELWPLFLAQVDTDNTVRQAADDMARQAWDYHGVADEQISRLTPQWSLSRLAVVDRNVLRLALWELAHQSDVPPKVVLNEAIELAREFSTEESTRFVNGVLDAALKERAPQTG